MGDGERDNLSSSTSSSKVALEFRGVTITSENAALTCMQRSSMRPLGLTDSSAE